MATLVTNQRITAADHFQDTRHIEFDLGEDGPIYEPGDVLSIFPRQDENAVKSLLARMGLDPEARVRIELREAPAGAPGGLSMEVSISKNFPTRSSSHARHLLVAGLVRTTINGAMPFTGFRVRNTILCVSPAQF